MLALVTEGWKPVGESKLCVYFEDLEDVFDEVPEVDIVSAKQEDACGLLASDEVPDTPLLEPIIVLF